MKLTGRSPDGVLPEIVELRRPSVVHRGAVSPRTEEPSLRPAPAVFASFIAAAKEHERFV
jgi:CTP synthase